MKKLKFAVMCDSFQLQEFEARAIENLLCLESADLVLVILNGSEDQNHKSHGIRRVLKWLRSPILFFALYLRFIHKPKAVKRRDAGPILSRVSKIVCRPTLRGKYSQYFDPSDVAAIAEHDLDFILRFGFNIIRGEILRVPRYGIWSFHHDDEMKYRGVPPCFWEIYNRDPVTGALIQALSDRLDGGLILKKAFFCTTDYSWAENIDRIFFESANWPAELCTKISQGHFALSDARPSVTNASINKVPNNIQMLAFLWVIVCNYVRSFARSYFSDEIWNVGLVKAPIADLIGKPQALDVEWFPPPPLNRYFADPFGMLIEGSRYVLFEDYSHNSKRGSISCAAITDQGTFRQIEDVMSPDYHLSYPYTFRQGEEVYCMPESSAVKKVVLHRCMRFPTQWKEEATLLDGIDAVDATLVFFDSSWWLFCTRNERDPNLNLFVYFSKSLTGPYTPHPLNPVKSDVRSSRPAGTPFFSAGRLYRPAQDCSRTYGGAICLLEITKLTTSQFSESVVCHFDPAADGLYAEGLHHMAMFGNETLVDGKRIELRLGRIFRKLRGRFSGRGLT